MYIYYLVSAYLTKLISSNYLNTQFWSWLPLVVAFGDNSCSHAVYVY